jgi:CRP/FNR family transcriptional regulator, cyclic AMP receptor protein
MRIRTPVDEHLGEMPLFAGLSTKNLRVVPQLSTSIDLPAGTALAQEGTTGREFFMLVDGEVEVIRTDRLVATRGPGSHLGEIALLEGRPRTATLVAKTQLLIAVASRSEFTSLLQLVPEISERLHASMHQRLAELVAPT